MADTRDPMTEPLHPDPRMKTNNAHEAAAALRAKHSASIALAQRALSGEKISPDEKQMAADVLDALVAILGENGPTNVALGYLLEASVTATRMRREREAATAPERPAAA